MNYLITRHAGALRWLQEQLQAPGLHVCHLDQSVLIGAGDRVVGTLPVNLIAAICARGARYQHLEIDMPACLRGQEITTAQLTALNARLVEYVAFRTPAR